MNWIFFAIMFAIFAYIGYSRQKKLQNMTRVEKEEFLQKERKSNIKAVLVTIIIIILIIAIGFLAVLMQ